MGLFLAIYLFIYGGMAARPDLLVVTGDLLDGPIPQEEEVAQWLRAVEAPLGKFFILGNHEMYEGVQHAERFASLAGLKLLRDETVQISETLEMSGVDDPALVEQNGGKAPRDLALLPVLSGSRARVFLKHRPVIETDAVNRFDVQLSGHTHSGQIFPFGYFTNLFATRPCGLHAMGNAWLAD